MATKIGASVTFDLSGQNPAVQLLDVPAGTQLVLFQWTGYADGFGLSGATLEGVALTPGVAVAGSSSSGSNGTGSAWLVNPPTGEDLDLDWSWTAAPAEGPTVVVSFWGDVDTASPVPDSDAIAWVGTATQSVTLSTSSTDTVVGVVQSYNSTPDAAPSGSGQTALDVVNHSFNSEHVTLAQENTPGASTTVFSGTGDYGSIAAVVIRTLVVAGAASMLPPGIRNQVRQALRHF
jgi:hypothetical protein